MKRSLYPLLAVLVLALVVAACGADQTTTAEATTASSTTTTTEAEATTESDDSATTETTTTDGSASLTFPVDTYTEETTTVTTATGDVEVTYRLYAHIPYVANPVNTDYQSLDVKVPVTINGEAVDASNAPMLLQINVGGYMSVSNAAGGTGVGAPVGGLTDEETSDDSTEAEVTPPTDAEGGPPSGGGTFGSGGSNVGDLALAAGYVVVVPGVRGRDNQAEDGTYFGKAPAAIVDLKAAVRYVRANDDLIPGNAEWIVSRGTSAGGALSALLGASGDSALYEPYLEALGAAEASDAIFASADFCPITDLEHADMAYEWTLGSQLTSSETTDQELSALLAAAYPEYLASLSLQGADDFGTITADNFGEYLVQRFLAPSATTYLLALSDTDRQAYLTENAWITWADDAATFSFTDYVTHAGRSKDVPAFDALDLSAAENILFGTETINARHFTTFSLQQSSGGDTAELDADLPAIINLMNPMVFITQGCEGCAQYWWLRQGSSDTDTALTVFANLATSLENQGQDVNSWLYWDAGHGADEDPEAFIAWIGEITGYTQ